MRRFACLWLPRWPLQRFRQASPGRNRLPLILYQETSRAGQQVAYASAALQQDGITPGQSLTDARALLGNKPVEIALVEPARDLWALRQLAQACQRFSPIVSVEDRELPDSLLFEITGCTHLFGDEQTLCREILNFVAAQGYRGRLAIADTVGLAWGIAHCGVHRRQQFRIVHGQDLRGLPAAALRLPASVLDRLQEFDLRFVDQILRLSRSTLKPRFGPELPQRLDQLAGRLPELLIPETLPEPIRLREQFEEPTTDIRYIEFQIEQLLDAALTQLQKLQHGILRLKLTFEQDKSQAEEILMGMIRPLCDKQELQKLLALKLERIHFFQPVTTLELHAIETAPLRYRQSTLFVETNWLEDQERDSLLNRLSIRLGEQAVLRVRRVEDVQPERSLRYIPAIQGTAGETTSSESARNCRELPLRPAVMFPQPVQVRVNSVVPAGPPLRFWWKEQEFLTEIAWGPERIETGWWREAPARRDYYRVETTSRQRFWLFRRRDQRDWYLHGCFD